MSCIKNGKFINCKVCKKSFYVAKWQIKRGEKFCSQKCFGLSKIGHIPWNKKPKIKCNCLTCGKVIFKQLCRIKSGRGKFCSVVCLNRARLGEKHGMWKGKNVGYSALHTWVKRRLGKPAFCAFNKEHNNRGLQWANKSHQYKRDLSDWVSLCISCHKKYDLKFVKFPVV